MAHPLFVGDISLGSLDCNRSDGFELNTGYDNQEAFVPKERSSWLHCMRGGKESYPAGFVDYLGALPALESGTGLSYVRSDSVNNSESLSTQLTLFYAGTVNVFENVTADKAQMIMSFAGGGNSSWQAMDAISLTASLSKGPETPSIKPSFTFDLQVQDSSQQMRSKVQEDPTAASTVSAGKRIQVSNEGQGQKLADFFVPCQAVVPKALPIARKESLARFLERRRERVRMKAPYGGKGTRCGDCSTASTQMPFYGVWTVPGMHPMGFNAELVGGNSAYVEERDWVTNYVNSKQVSEGESTT